MPIYEYACKSCEHVLDALQKMSDDPLIECPECGKPSLKRLISAPRFRLKGKGWYETDFKKDNQRNLSSGDGEQAKEKSAESKAKDKTSADTKSDGSGDSKTKTMSDTGSKATSAKKTSTKTDSS